MEQGVVVALFALAGSFLTVLITGAFNTLSKWIDSQQKVKEHQYSLRSIYVTRKIDAGQAFAAKASTLLTSLRANADYIQRIKEEKRVDNTFHQRVAEVDNAYYKSVISGNDYTSLYFQHDDTEPNFTHLMNQSNASIGKLNDFINNLNEDGSNYSQDFENEINNFLRLNKKAIKLVEDSVTRVYKELAKYDIL